MKETIKSVQAPPVSKFEQLPMGITVGELKSLREIADAREDILIIDINAVEEPFSEVLKEIQEARSNGCKKSLVLRCLGQEKLDNSSFEEAEIMFLRAGGDAFVWANDAAQLKVLESRKINVLKTSIERLARQKSSEQVHGMPEYEWGNFRMWTNRRVFTVKGEEVYLPKAHWKIMEKFLEKKHDILRYEFLDSVSPTRLGLAASIKRMNKKLRPLGFEIVSEPTVGYKITTLETQ